MQKGLPVGVAALAAAALILISTRWGVGASPDSVVYLGTARNVVAGRGLTVPYGSEVDRPLTFYPPLYPAVLAGLGLAAGDPVAAARWLAAGLFCANVLLAGLLAGWRGAAPWQPLAAAGLLLTAPTMVGLHSMAWSEPLFLGLGFGGLLLLARTLEQGDWAALVLAGAALGLALLTRYAGLAFVGAGCLALVLFSDEPWRARLVRAGVLGGIAVAPLLAWTARNQALAGTATDRALAFHPIGLVHARQALDTLASWLLLPPDNGLWVKAGVPLALAGGVAALAFWQARQPVRAMTARAARMWTPLDKVLGLFILVYAAFLAASITLVDANTPLDARILSPVFVAGLVLAVRLVGAGVARFATARSAAVMMIALAAFGGLSLWQAAGVVRQSYHNGIGFNSANWRSSPTLAWLRRLPEETIVYANAPEPVYLHTERNALRLPRQFDTVAQTANAEYPAELALLAEQLSAGAVAVYFQGVRSSSGPSEAELVAALALTPVAQTADGTIYVLTP